MARTKFPSNFHQACTSKQITKNNTTHLNNYKRRKIHFSLNKKRNHNSNLKANSRSFDLQNALCVLKLKLKVLEGVQGLA